MKPRREITGNARVGLGFRMQRQHLEARSEYSHSHRDRLDTDLLDGRVRRNVHIAYDVRVFAVIVVVTAKAEYQQEKAVSVHKVLPEYGRRSGILQKKRGGLFPERVLIPKPDAWSDGTAFSQRAAGGVVRAPQGYMAEKDDGILPFNFGRLGEASQLSISRTCPKTLDKLDSLVTVPIVAVNETQCVYRDDGVVSKMEVLV
jgi:hypothetical protein